MIDRRRALRLGVGLSAIPVLILGVVAWWTATGEDDARIEVGDRDRVTDLAFSPDGQTIAATTANGLKAWTLPERRLAWTFGTGPYQALAWSPDGRFVAASGREVQIWRVADGALGSVLRGHTGIVDSIAWSPDGATLASAGRDQTIRLWAMRDGAGTPTHTLRDHRYLVRSVAFSPDGRHLVSGSWDRKVGLWQVDDGGLLRLQDQDDLFAVEAVAVSPDGLLTAIAGASGLVGKPAPVLVRRLADGTLVRRLEGPQEAVNSVAFSPDGRWLVGGMGAFREGISFTETVVRLWAINDGHLLQTHRGHHAPVTRVAFNPAQTIIGSGSYDGTVRLWAVP
jgi:WD40 repeat protein